VVGISDAYGALYDSNGLNIPELLEQRDSFGTVTKLFEDTITNKELLEQECDILVPAAIENQITKDNAANVKASVIVEAANGPTTTAATKILSDKGVLIVPDVLGNSGGVIVSYFEWVQNNQGYYWSEEEIDKKLVDLMRKSFHTVYEAAHKYGVDMRLAAYMVGVRRMAESARWRGWV
jgi:glutamate dehydrogenase